MPDAAKFWDRHADGYAKKPVKDVASYERTLECTRRRLSADAEVLEIGCGTGTTALHLAPAVGQLTATDVSGRMIEIARQKADDPQVGNVRFQQATLFDGELPAGPFDAVLAFNLLHLLPDIPAAVGRMRDLLKPGGLFISKTPCLAEQSRLWKPLLAVLTAVGIAPPVRCLKIAELEEMIAGAGFEILETGLYPPSPPSRFLVARGGAARPTDREESGRSPR